jgi:hypothetical protein
MARYTILVSNWGLARSASSAFAMGEVRPDAILQSGIAVDNGHCVHAVCHAFFPSELTLAVFGLKFFVVLVVELQQRHIVQRRNTLKEIVSFLMPLFP